MSSAVTPRIDKALTREQILAMELAKQQSLTSQLAQVAIALLKEKHGGRAFVSQAVIAECANWNLNVEPLQALGTFRLQAIMPNGEKWLGLEAAQPQQAPTEAVAPQTVELAEPETVEPPSQACGDPWHSNPEAVGLLCAMCGSRARIEIAGEAN